MLSEISEFLIKRLGIAPAVCLAIALFLLTFSFSQLKDLTLEMFGGALLTAGGFVAWARFAFLRDKDLPGGDDNADQPDGSHKQLELRLMWTHQFQFVGIYHAAKQLEKTAPFKVLEGGAPMGLDSRAMVHSGEDDLGITSTTSLIEWFLTHRNDREPRRLYPLLVIFQRSPACLIYRVQNALPKDGLGIQHLTGKRFWVVDSKDPAVMEFGALARDSGVRTLQWVAKSVRHTDHDQPNSELQAGGRADFRIGYTYNEGYRAKVSNPALSYVTFADVFGRPQLYADVLFTRYELVQDPASRARIRTVVDQVKDSYFHFINPATDLGTRTDEVNLFMEMNCHDWWSEMKPGKIYDATARALLEQLDQAWGGAGTRNTQRLGDAEIWKKLEIGVLGEMGEPQTNPPYHRWLFQDQASATLDQQ